jgi:hypothetical protein
VQFFQDGVNYRFSTISRGFEAFNAQFGVEHLIFIVKNSDLNV